MSIFDELSSIENNNYPYHSYIKTPEQLGSSSQGNLSALKSDMAAIGAYTEVLLTGHSDGQTVSPLGNKYFMPTGATCVDPSGTSQSRYVYINNIPDGNIPLMGTSTNYEGLVPGVLEDIGYVNPIKLFSAFSKGTSCQQITMDTRDISNNTVQQSEYILDDDIKDYNACWFLDGKNPVTQETCQEGMQMPNDPGVKLYTACVGLLGIYIAFQLMRK